MVSWIPGGKGTVTRILVTWPVGGFDVHKWGLGRRNQYWRIRSQLWSADSLLPTSYWGPLPLPRNTQVWGNLCHLFWEFILCRVSPLVFFAHPTSLLSVGLNERHCHSYPRRGGEESGQKMSGESCLDQLHEAHRVCQNWRSVPWAIVEVAARANNAY